MVSSVTKAHSHIGICSENMPINASTKDTSRKFLSELFAKESISKSQTLSTKARICVMHPKPSPIDHTTRCLHHRCSPHHTTRAKRKKRLFLNTPSFPTNIIATFTLATIMMSSRMNPSSMATAFVTAPPATKTRVVQMDHSLICRSSVAVDDDNKMFFGRVEFEKYDGFLDMSSSVATTAATSSASSITSPEQYQYSLRTLLVSSNVHEQIENTHCFEFDMLRT